MALSVGARLDSYEIVGLLGAGGMGEVYRALDTRLNRHVAIKVLPEAYAADPERVARFHREAQAVAALNHPRIAAIYDFADAGEAKFLVLELVDGDTLADLLRRGKPPIGEAIAIAIQILDALEAAHEKGICHRDLKPANIKITADGVVKVLDFGLAKFLESGSSSPNLTQSPTLSVAGTIPGVILGTAGYMSPEQAKGFHADHRSDIFSFGCVLYEMLTGRQAFDGDSVSEILAGIIKSDVDLTSLPRDINPRLTELLRRCLEKSPKKRWHAAADVRVELESIAARPTEIGGAPALAAPLPLWRRALPWAAGGLVGALLAAPAVWIYRTPPAPVVVRFEISLPQDQAFTNAGRHVLAISPDGRRLVYVANRRLYVRDVDAVEAQPIQGSEAGGGGVLNPVFSPDGRSIVFWAAADQTLKRISINGGTPATVARISIPFGISWDHQERIVYSTVPEGVLEVPAIGGEPKVLVVADKGKLITTPQLLPDGATVLYSARLQTDNWTKGEVVVQPVGGIPKTLIGGAADARYLPTGHIVYASAGVMRAARFDSSRLELRGESVNVVEGVRRVGVESGATTGFAHVAFSASGTLAFISGPTRVSNTDVDELAIFDGKGAVTPLKLPPAPYFSPRVSADGKSIAYDIDDAKQADIWVYQLSGTSAARRLTFGGRNKHATWSSDGQWVFFQSDREGDLAIFRQRADGAGQAERLTRPGKDERHSPQSASPDGRHLIFTVEGARARLADLNLADGTVSPIDGTESSDRYNEGALSPDGRWLAFYTRPARDAERQVFLQPFPATGARYLVLSGIGGHPFWTRDGKHLIINVSPVESRKVAVTTPAVQFGEPEPFSRAGRTEPNPSFSRRAADALPDGQIVGVVSQTNLSDSTRFTVVLNWFDELRRLVPAR